MDTIDKLPKRVLKQLPRQLNYLMNSCENFDEGQHEESVRIAVTLRTLFHDTKKSTSLLKLLGIKNDIKIASTCRPTKVVKQHQYFAHDPLTYLDEKKKMKPILATKEEAWFIPVIDWWEKYAIVILVPGVCVSRKAIVLAAANRDGGTHVGEYTDEYEYLDQGFWQSGNSWYNEHQFILLRQLAFEVINSPDIRNLSDYCKKIS